MVKKLVLLIVIPVILLLNCSVYRKFFKSNKTEQDVLTVSDIDIPTKGAKKEREWNKLTKDEKKQRNEAVKLVNKGNEALKKSEFKDAVEYFNDALSKWELPEAYLGLGNAYYKTGEYEKAIKAMDNYIAFVVNNPSPYFVKGLCYKKLGDEDNALKSLLMASKLKKDDPITLTEIGNIYFDKKSYDEANDYYEEAQKLDTSIVETYLGIGNIYLALKDYEKAKKEFEDGLKIKEDKRLEDGLNRANGFISFTKGIELYKNKKYKEAEKPLLEAVGYLPESFEVNYTVAMLYEKMGNYTNSLKYFNKSIDIDSDKKGAYIGSANSYFKLNKYEEALNLLTKASEKWKDDFNIYNLMGLIYTKTESWTKAIEYFNKVIKINPKYAIGYFNLGNAYYNAEKYEDALKSFKKAYELDDDLKDALSNANKAEAMILTAEGNEFFDKEKYNEAIEKYKKALNLQPRFIETIVNLGNAYLAIGKNSDALNQFEKALKIDENYFSALNGMLRAYRELGRVDDEKRISEKLENLKGNDPILYYKLGLSFESKQKYNEAIAEYKKALELDSSFKDAKKRIALVHYKNGILLYNDGKYNEAMDEFKTALNINPSLFDAKDKLDYLNAMILVNKASDFYNKGKLDSAIDSYKEAIKIYPNLKEVYLNIARLYMIEEDYENAEKILKKGVNKAPDYMDYYFTLGDIYKTKNDFRRAYDYFAKALELQPDNDEIYNQIGEIFLKEDNYDEALKNFKEALKLNPKNSDAHINLGIAYFEKGDYKQAANEFDSTRKLEPGYVAAYYNAGLAYYKLNEYKTSEENFKHAIRLENNVPSFYFYLARTQYYMSGKIDEALENVEKALSMQKTPIYYYGSGKIYEKKMETTFITEKPKYLKKALDSYETVIKMERGTTLAEWAYERIIALSPEVRLEQRFILSGGLQSNPYFDKNILFAGDDNGVLHFIDTKGEKTFFNDKVKLDSAITSDIVYKDTMTFVGTKNGRLYMIDLNGEIRYTYDVPYAIIGNPILIKESIIFADEGGNIYSLNLTSKKLLWRSQLGDEPIGGIEYSGKYIYSATKDGTVYCLSSETGEIVWSKTMVGNILNKITVSKEILAVGTDRGILYLLSLDDGRVIKKFTLGGSIYSGIAIDGKRIYVGASSILYALDLNDNEVWKFYANGNIISRLTVQKDEIIFGTDEGEIYDLKLSNGTKKWLYVWDSPIVGTPISVSKNIALVSSSDGSVLELYYKSVE